MNRPLRRVAVACLALFGLLFVNANWIQLVKASDYRTRSGNQRILLDEYSRKRGEILVDGQPVARSQPTNDRLKYLRRYSDGELYAHETGYYSSIYGSTGIERAENSILAGTDDRLFVRRVVDLVTGNQAQGGSVELTLDPKAQRAAYQGLGSQKGAVVALDPSTGAILAMASTPSYDPNLLATHDTRAMTRSYKRLSQDRSTPLLNRAISQTYPPGSTFKLVTAAAALGTGRYKASTQVPGPASLKLPQSTKFLPNENGAPCGPNDTTTLLDALRISCNTAFASVGLDLGETAIRDQAERFGFNDDFSVPMPTAKSVFPSNLDRAQTALSAIGQFDVRVTPLQMAMVAAGIADNGEVRKPYLVKVARAPDLSPVDKANPDTLHRAMSPGDAAKLRDMMVAVVQSGTGVNAQIPGVTVAGKTGTAQRGKGEAPLAWFVSFADPGGGAKVAVAVVIEDAGTTTDISGGRLAAPIAKAVMKAVLGR